MQVLVPRFLCKPYLLQARKTEWLQKRGLVYSLVAHGNSAGMCRCREQTSIDSSSTYIDYTGVCTHLHLRLQFTH